ncbi:hypothetical protein SAMN05216588_104266 [Pseudomonas flavescens]|uniref:Uncharacterized protein n=1 Tax=Phytopseudomonas flavescens TaxID=29435 RepID=A0A1G8C4R2_9GAMM|nr:hypothetical protein SAMN05216588_104266 [Pseudomonas flavescens]
METLNGAVQTLIHGSNTLFILIGAIMVLAIHAGFAFLSAFGSVRSRSITAPTCRYTDWRGQPRLRRPSARRILWSIACMAALNFYRELPSTLNMLRFGDLP